MSSRPLLSSRPREGKAAALRFLLRLLASLPVLVATPAFADFVVAPSGGNMTGAQVSAALASGDYALVASSGDVVINDVVSWSTHTLTLTAANSVNVNAVMTASGNGRLVVNTGSSGSVNMALGGNSFGGRVDFSGSLANRYSVNGQVYTLIDAGADLQATVTANLSGYYALAADNTHGVGTRVGALWGQFDGLGHVVQGVNLNAGTSYAGLFGHVEINTPGAIPVVRNLGVQGNVASNGAFMFIGGIAGVNDGILRNVFFVGSVAGGQSSQYVGGLAGVNNGSIENAYAYTGGVSATYYVGGLVGSNNGGGTISHAFATAAGSVSGSDHVGALVGTNGGSIADSSTSGTASGNNGSIGGLVGENRDTGAITRAYAVGNVGGNTGGGLVGSNSGIIQYAYATGTVSSNTGGGLVGSNTGTIRNAYATGDVAGGQVVMGGLVGANSGTISNAYATGSIYGNDRQGGLVGTNQGSVSNAFYAITNANGDPTNGYDGTNLNTGAPWQGNAYGTARTLAQLKTLATFSDPSWAIDDAGATSNTWRLYGGYTTPLLRSYLAPLTFTVASAPASIVYDGNPHSGPGTWVVTPANYDTSRVLGTGVVDGVTHAGVQALRVSGVYSMQTGYDIAIVPGTITILPAPLAITPVAGQQKRYGADDPPAGFGYAHSGEIGSDDVLLAGHLGRFAGEGAGQYTYNLGGLAAGNADYAIALASSTGFAITPAPVVVTPDGAQSKVLGSADPVFTYATGGLVNATAPHYWDAAGHYASAAEIDDTSLVGALGRMPGETVGYYAYTLGTLDGGSNYTLALAANAPTFGIYAIPAVTSLSPAFGPMNGGTAVTITGSGFASGVTTVKFGANAATSVTVTSAANLVATAPPASLGAVDVTVTTPGGTSATSDADQYAYREDVVLSASIAERDGFAAYGGLVQYDIVVRNTGSANAAAVTITTALPNQINAAQALWLCMDAGLCTPEGNGSLSDVASLTAHGSVHYLLIALVRPDAQGNVVHAGVHAAGTYFYETADGATDTPLVIFHGGFEE